MDVLQRNAVIVGAIARYVDDLARGDDFAVAFVEHEGGAFQRRADRGACAGRARDGADFLGQGRGARLILDERPIEHDPVIIGAGPIEHGHRDAAERAALDRLDDVRIEKDFRDSLALKLRLLFIDAEGDVGGDDELDVHLDWAFRRGGGRQGRERGQQPAKQGQLHPATEHIAARLRPHHTGLLGTFPSEADDSLQRSKQQTDDGFPSPLGGRVRLRGRLRRAGLAEPWNVIVWFAFHEEES